MARPDPVLFCPFCRESFEGRVTCPDHELPLVRWDELPPEPSHETDDAPQRFALHEPRHGRGIVVAGAVLALIGFVLPVVHSSMGGGVELSGTMLASTRAGNLWTVPLVAASVIALVLRPRTLEALRSVRLGVLVGAVVGLASVTFTSARLLEAARTHQARTGATLLVEPRVGVYVMVVGLLLVVVGSVRLGEP